MHATSGSKGATEIKLKERELVFSVYQNLILLYKTHRATAPSIFLNKFSKIILKVMQRPEQVVLQSHVTNENHYISILECLWRPNLAG